MNQYDITILYAGHDPQKPKISDFPGQTLESDRIQVIKVLETDPAFPRRNSLKLLEKAQGDFVMMLDEGDSFEANLLSDMLEKIKDYAAFAMLSLTMKDVGKEVEYASKNDSRTLLINTARFPGFFPLELHGTLFRTDSLKEAVKVHASSPEPEKQIILYLLEQNPVFQYIGSDSIQYSYPREYDSGFTTRDMDKGWYYQPFEEFALPLLKTQEQHPVFIRRILQLMVVHMIHVRFRANQNNRNKHVMEREEVFSYLNFLTKVLSYVTIENLLVKDVKPTAAAVTLRLLDIRIKKNDYTWLPDLICEKDGFSLQCEGNLLTDSTVLSVGIQVMDYKKGALEIDGEMQDLFREEDLSLFVRLNGKTYPVVYNQRYSLTKSFGITYAHMKTFHVSVPLPEDVGNGKVLQFILSLKGHEYLMQIVFPTQHSRLSGKYGYSYWTFSRYFTYAKEDGIHIVKRNPVKTLYKEVRFWMEVLQKKDPYHRKLLLLRLLHFILQPYFSRKRIWLFQDKIYKGGDNSEYIYRYAAAQKDGIQKYYLLDKDSADYERLKKDGYKPLVRGSIKHKLIFLNADLVVASNSTVFAFNDFKVGPSNMIRGLVHFDVACVQHGMSVQKIALAMQRLRDNTKLYFCASKYELENLSKPVYDYKGYDVLKLTGVPRFDGLKDRAEKVILLSPTWRMNSALPVVRNEGVSRPYNPHFKETSYFQVYNSLINDPRLLAAAKKYGYRIKYVLHPIVSPQYEDFDQNDFVEIISAIGDTSYEKLFCESALMVTDFSGVQFDFAYMRKPVVYLHHESIPEHYDEGTFFYPTMGFGEICRNNDELITVLCRYMENGCQMSDLYRSRADDFFAFNDHNNCERIYQVMLEHQKQKDQEKTS